MDANLNRIAVVIDSRELGDKDIDDVVNGYLKRADAAHHEIELLRNNGMVTVFVDNLDAVNTELTDKLQTYISKTMDRVVIAPSGDTHYTPSMKPTFLPSSVGYYLIQEVTLSKAHALAVNAIGDLEHSTPNEIVAKSFKSTSNLGTNRSMYFMAHLIRTFAETNNAAEPLDRYLLQKNIIDLELTRAHYEVRRSEIFDDAVYNQFLGQLAYFLYDKGISVFTEEMFSELADAYRNDMGKLPKQFPPAVILEVLLRSHVLRRIGLASLKWRVFPVNLGDLRPNFLPFSGRVI